MHPQHRFLALIVISGALLTPVARAGLVVENVVHLCRVISGTNIQDQVFAQPNPQPYNVMHTASIEETYCSATYDSEWSKDTGVFSLGMAHHLEGLEGRVIPSGSYRIRPSVDSILTVNGSFAYAHVPGELSSASFFVTGRLDGGPLIFSTGGSGGTVGLGSPNGTINAVESAFLQAGNLYRIGYVFSTDIFDPPPPRAVWAGDGGFTFTITPVPEPTAVFFLAAGFLIVRKKR